MGSVHSRGGNNPQEKQITILHYYNAAIVFANQRAVTIKMVILLVT